MSAELNRVPLGNKEASYEPKMSRRGFNKWALGLMATAAAGGGGIYRVVGSGNSEAPSGSFAGAARNEEPTAESAAYVAPGESAPLEQGEPVVAAFTRNPNLFDGREAIDPELYREIAETYPEELSGAFYITSEQASNPEVFVEVFAHKLTAALNTGCGSEIENYDANSIDEFVRDMGDKYDMSIYRGLLLTRTHDEQGNVYTEEDIRSRDDFKLFSRLRSVVLARFAQHAFRTGNLNEIILVSALDSTPDRNVFSNGHYGTTVDLRFTNKMGDGDSTKDYYDFVGKDIYIPTWPQGDGNGIASTGINDYFGGIKGVTEKIGRSSF